LRSCTADKELKSSKNGKPLKNQNRGIFLINMSTKPLTGSLIQQTKQTNPSRGFNNNLIQIQARRIVLNQDIQRGIRRDKQEVKGSISTGRMRVK
jgi:hypothetical protein